MAPGYAHGYVWPYLDPIFRIYRYFTKTIKQNRSGLQGRCGQRNAAGMPQPLAAAMRN